MALSADCFVNGIYCCGACLEGEIVGDVAGEIIWQDQPPHEYAVYVYNRKTKKALYAAQHAKHDDALANLSAKMKEYDVTDSPETAKAKLALADIAMWLTSYSERSSLAQRHDGFYDMMTHYARGAIKACGYEPAEKQDDLFAQCKKIKSELSELAYPPNRDGLRRYWTSWYSALDADDGLPFECWITGETLEDPPRYTYCANIDAESVEAAFKLVAGYFPDYTERFCNAVDRERQMGDRFQ